MDRIYNQTILDSIKKKNAPPLPPKGPPCRIIKYDFPDLSARTMQDFIKVICEQFSLELDKRDKQIKRLSKLVCSIASVDNVEDIIKGIEDK